MTRILFVCLGNICRSPVAEGILLHFNSKHQLGLEIDSAGTASYHIGKPPDSRTIANALRNGVDLSDLRASQFSAEDFDRFDVIYVMDKNNLSDVLRHAKSEEHRNKVSLFLGNYEVPDPYYGDEKDFEEVFQLIYGACQKLIGDK